MKRILSSFKAATGKALGPLEQRLLQELWSRGSGTVRELVDDGDHKLAYTTLMTTLDRLFKKGVLNRMAEGKAFRYSPRQTPEEFQRAAAGEAILQLFNSGAASSLPLSYLVEILIERDTQLLDDLQELVEKKRRELRNRDLKALEPKPKERP
jgi:BlaI family transcriptional regulator, penicillinase repressor